MLCYMVILSAVIEDNVQHLCDVPSFFRCLHGDKIFTSEIDQQCAVDFFSPCQDLNFKDSQWLQYQTMDEHTMIRQFSCSYTS